MAGYTPLFSSLTTGTLLGRWPDIGLWPVMLSMADVRGEIDVTQDYIALVTGLPLTEVTECIDRFMQPDPRSRSQVEDGRRLVLMDPHRSWGWKVVNIRKYRDKASGQNQASDGRNAEKVKRYKAKNKVLNTGGHRETPADTGGHLETPQTPTHTHTHTQTKNKKDLKNLLDAARPTREEVSRGSEDSEFLELKLAYPPRSGDYRWRQARQAINARIAEGHLFPEIIAGALRYARYCESAGKAGTEYVMQASRFCGPDKPFLLPWKPPPKAETASERILRLNGGDNSRIIEHEPDTPKFLESH